MTRCRQATHFIDALYENIGWTPPQELTPERVGRFFRFMTERGVTALFEALVEDDEVLQAIAELDRRGELNMYCEGALRFLNSDDLPGVIALLKSHRAEYASKHVNVNTLKLFLDGTNETGNSAVLAPMCNHASADYRGDIGMETAELTRCFLLFNTEGADVHIHVVGDRSFRTACDAVEAARTEIAATGDVWRIQVTLAHCELVGAADMHRPAEFGIIVN